MGAFYFIFFLQKMKKINIFFFQKKKKSRKNIFLKGFSVVIGGVSFLIFFIASIFGGHIGFKVAILVFRKNVFLHFLNYVLINLQHAKHEHHASKNKKVMAKNLKYSPKTEI